MRDVIYCYSSPTSQIQGRILFCCFYGPKSHLLLFLIHFWVLYKTSFWWMKSRLVGQIPFVSWWRCKPVMFIFLAEFQNDFPIFGRNLGLKKIQNPMLPPKSPFSFHGFYNTSFPSEIRSPQALGILGIRAQASPMLVGSPAGAEHSGGAGDQIYRENGGKSPGKPWETLGNHGFWPTKTRFAANLPKEFWDYGDYINPFFPLGLRFVHQWIRTFRWMVHELRFAGWVLDPIIGRLHGGDTVLVTYPDSHDEGQQR